MKVHYNNSMNTLEELKESLNDILRLRILNKNLGIKYIGDISKVKFTKTEYGKLLKELGYVRIRIQKDNIRQYYYYIPE